MSQLISFSLLLERDADQWRDWSFQSAPSRKTSRFGDAEVSYRCLVQHRRSLTRMLMLTISRDLQAPLAPANS